MRGWLRVDRARRDQILALALPIIGGMTSQNILNLVDTAMVGRLGPAALAGVGIVSFLSFLSVAAVTGMSSAVQAMAARRFGEGKHGETAVSLNGGLLVALCYGLPVSLLLWYASEAIVAALINDPAVVEAGGQYFQMRVLGIIFVGMNFSFRGYWSAVNLTRLYLRTLVIMHLVNVFLNYVLIFGHWGFPQMGTAGAGLGTTLSIMLGTAIYYFLASGHARENGFLKRFPSAQQLKDLLRLGVPASVTQVLFAGGFTALFWIIAKVGTEQLAVANVLINITLVAILPGIGFGIAAATLAGQALGRREPLDAHAWVWDVCRVAALAFLGLSIIMLLATDAVLGIFLTDPDLVALGHWPLKLVGVGIIVDGIGLILMQALLGVGASAAVMRVSVGLQWLFFLPLAYLIGPVLGAGLLAIWLAMNVYRGLQATIFAVIWQRRAWTRIEV